MARKLTAKPKAHFDVASRSDRVPQLTRSGGQKNTCLVVTECPPVFFADDLSGVRANLRVWKQIKLAGG